uniref:Uncharacterized protein n=1 Tax=Rhizophagus irregularis (strain DAOM 181602 / DAOM 197198 / MUCL 43194) TaxID=747089 RepID=U9TBP9_RHIID
MDMIYTGESDSSYFGFFSPNQIHIKTIAILDFIKLKLIILLIGVLQEKPSGIEKESKGETNETDIINDNKKRIVTT